jgi:hypothetical protein
VNIRQRFAKRVPAGSLSQASSSKRFVCRPILGGSQFGQVQQNFSLRVPILPIPMEIQQSAKHVLLLRGQIPGLPQAFQGGFEIAFCPAILRQ